MKKSTFVLIVMCISLSAKVYAQANNEVITPPTQEITEAKKNGPFIKVENMPEFPGGDAALFKYLGKHLKYPKKAKKRGISGTVYVYFEIDETGNVTQVEVKRGVKGGEVLDTEAVRIVQSMPKWKPGSQGGKPAIVQYILPIKFILK